MTADLLPLHEIERALRAVPLRGFPSTTLPPLPGTTIPATSWEVDYPTLAREVARMLEERREADAKIPETHNTTIRSQR